MWCSIDKFMGRCSQTLRSSESLKLFLTFDGTKLDYHSWFRTDFLHWYSHCQLCLSPSLPLCVFIFNFFFILKDHINRTLEKSNRKVRELSHHQREKMSRMPLLWFSNLFEVKKCHSSESKQKNKKKIKILTKILTIPGTSHCSILTMSPVHPSFKHFFPLKA